MSECVLKTLACRGLRVGPSNGSGRNTQYPFTLEYPKGPRRTKNATRSKFTTCSEFTTALEFTIVAHLVRAQFSWEIQTFLLSKKGPRRSKYGGVVKTLRRSNSLFFYHRSILVRKGDGVSVVFGPTG